MELTKIFLIFIFWPADAPAEQPKWTSEPFITVEDCRKKAEQQTEIIRARHGSETKVVFHCLSIDDRISE